MSIGEVLSLLRRDFPDVTISKIRFLESEGLVTPARTASGYRRFTSADIDQLKSVLTLQRDQYLPLKVIREQISDPGESGAIAGSGMQEADFRPGAGRVRLTRQELADECGLPLAYVTALEGLGIIWANPAGHYDEEALSIGQVIARLSSFGIEPRHLRTFRVVADRDTGLVEQMATPYTAQRGRDGKARERETVRELAALCIRLHAALLRAELVRQGRA